LFEKSQEQKQDNRNLVYPRFPALSTGRTFGSEFALVMIGQTW